jgi:hypothetical protein
MESIDECDHSLYILSNLANSLTVKALQSDRPTLPVEKTPVPKSEKRLARQHIFEPPPGFPLDPRVKIRHSTVTVSPVQQFHSVSLCM